MNSNDDFGRSVSAWLHDDAEHHVPDHLAAVLRRTGTERQRPAWSSLERWLPVQLTARFAPAPRLAWMLVVLALVLALAATALLVGSRTPPLPPPFGMNGRTVIYGATGGDLVALDTATNQSRPVITGSAFDSDPVVSPDGTMVAFIRREPDAPTTSLMVAGVDGSGVRELTSTVAGIVRMAWSPDGSRLAMVGDVNTVVGLWTVGLDHQLTLLVRSQVGEPIGLIEEPQWRPNGRELLFLAGPQDTVAQIGLYLVGADGTGLRTIVGPAAQGPGRPAVSPDGTRVAYSPRTSDHPRLHIVNVDTGDDSIIDFDGIPADVGPQWSADGTRLLFERIHSSRMYRLAVGPVTGGHVVEIGPARPDGSGGAQARFASDGTKVLAFYNSDRSSWILDPVDGSAFRLGEDIASPLSAPIAP